MPIAALDHPDCLFISGQSLLDVLGLTILPQFVPVVGSKLSGVIGLPFFAQLLPGSQTQGRPASPVDRGLVRHTYRLPALSLSVTMPPDIHFNISFSGRLWFIGHGPRMSPRSPPTLFLPNRSSF